MQIYNNKNRFLSFLIKRAEIRINFNRIFTVIE